MTKSTAIKRKSPHDDSRQLEWFSPVLEGLVSKQLRTLVLTLVLYLSKHLKCQLGPLDDMNYKKVCVTFLFIPAPPPLPRPVGTPLS